MQHITNIFHEISAERLSNMKTFCKKKLHLNTNDKKGSPIK